MEDAGTRRAEVTRATHPAPPPTSDELAAMLYAARTAAQSRPPSRLATTLAAALLSGTALFATNLADFPHNGDARPFLIGRGHELSSRRGAEPDEEIDMRRLKEVAVASALALTTAASAQNAVQWRVEDGGNGHWYLYVRDMAIGWQAASSVANSRGGYLATITSGSENAFLFAYLNTVNAWVDVRGPFLGGYQDRNAADYLEPSGGWKWVTNEPWSASNWANYGFGEPNNDFGVEDVLAMDNRFNGTAVWNDVALNGFAAGSVSTYRTATGYLIEWSADCNNDGLVDYGQILDGSLPDANVDGVPDCCLQGQPCDSNMLVNGSFEAGPLQTDCAWVLYNANSPFIPGWSVVAANVDRQRISTSCPSATESWRSYHGEFTIDLDGGTPGGAIAQTVGTTPGKRYRLSFQLTGNCTTGDKVMKVEVGTSNWQFTHTCQPSNPQPWSGKSVEFVAQSASTTIVLRSMMTNGTNGPVIDSVRLVEMFPACPGDITGNNFVDGVDLAALLAAWGGGKSQYDCDVDNDGLVGGSDLAVVLAGWGACP